MSSLKGILSSIFGLKPLAECDSLEEAKSKSEQEITKKKQEKDQMQQEEDQFIKDQKAKILEFLQESGKQFSEEKQKRNEEMDSYRKLSAVNKHKFNKGKRDQQRSIGEIMKETGKYSIRFLYLKTDDEILYKYKRKLQKEIQWRMLQNQFMPLITSYLLYALTRRLKKKGPMDIIYFAIPYLYSNYGIFIESQHKLFEIGYPAHPLILSKRAEVINAVCFYYPQILRNEIEYLHTKLHNFKGQEQQSIETLEETKYEREFEVGKGQKYKFKIVVQEGQIYLQCIDQFDQIFQFSKEAVEGMELTDILDPYIFENHKDIVNALYEVFFDLGTEYCQKQYFESKKIQEDATKKVRKRYGLDEDKSGQQEAKELLQSFKK